uniref:Zinc finger, CCHC-type, retrotransposon Gag domain protein n=1 Tax=Tanacetum cinerariifolium TaxID=118510 RepID=A0A6L2LZP3_TANCI|nr:hypothetical protein [Tanacetum cinerariifolium]
MEIDDGKWWWSMVVMVVVDGSNGGLKRVWIKEPGYETVGSKDLTCEDWMVNTRTDTDLSAAVQNALQALLPQIREEIREEFHTGSGSSNAGGNPPPVTIHTWLERFNKQKPHSLISFQENQNKKNPKTPHSGRRPRARKKKKF